MKYCLILVCAFLFQLEFCSVSFSQSIRFTPSVYYREFSASALPVLRINQGDTVITESVDAVGADKTGTRITERGNPLTGPFYIEQAQPGDVVAVTITSQSLNRNYATTLNALIPKVLDKKKARKTWRSAKLVKWTLDTISLTATPDPGFEKLRGVELPLHPFMGCVGVAPDGKSMSSGASGPFGGNMDFSYITSGATVYLPVFHPGALLFLGDGHAGQGDGELNGDALETSMNFSFTVRVIKQAAIKMPTPMIEDSSYFMILAIERNLDDALKSATMKLTAWLQQEYELNQQEVSQLIGPAIEYRIPKVGASQVEMVALIRKDLFRRLKRKME